MEAQGQPEILFRRDAERSAARRAELDGPDLDGVGQRRGRQHDEHLVRDGQPGQGSGTERRHRPGLGPGRAVGHHPAPHERQSGALSAHHQRHGFAPDREPGVRPGRRMASRSPVGQRPGVAVDLGLGAAELQYDAGIRQSQRAAAGPGRVAGQRRADRIRSSRRNPAVRHRPGSGLDAQRGPAAGSGQLPPAAGGSGPQRPRE
ncbi:hypothetical protein D3C80_1286720 [compost metagenome]